MVNHMKRLLPNLIADFQMAFFPGRHMDDNILVSHEITHNINKQRRGNNHLAALKLDRNKAYDRVNWIFLLKVLQPYGFPNHWLQMIRECISTANYRLLINGVVTSPFTPTCGLRQGGPLIAISFLFLHGYSVPHDNFGYGYPSVSRYKNWERWPVNFSFVLCR